MQNIKESFIHARNIERLLLGDHIGSGLFQKTENGFSSFFIITCLACRRSSAYQLAELYSLAITDGRECVAGVFSLFHSEAKTVAGLSFMGEFQEMLAISTGAFYE